MKRPVLFFALALLLGSCMATFASDAVDLAKRAEELKRLKWGMFVCWSFSTFSDKDWTPGVKDAAFFHPTGCDTDQWARAAKDAGMGYILNYLLAEFTYPILAPQKGGVLWFYSQPMRDAPCLPAEKIFQDYLGAVRYGNIFSLDVGPDRSGRLRENDLKTLQQVGRMIRESQKGVQP
jgi:alpha-L-fucosidase